MLPVRTEAVDPSALNMEFVEKVLDKRSMVAKRILLARRWHGSGGHRDCAPTLVIITTYIEHSEKQWVNATTEL